MKASRKKSVHHLMYQLKRIMYQPIEHKLLIGYLSNLFAFEYLVVKNTISCHLWGMFTATHFF
jgi:hypothetical protein